MLNDILFKLLGTGGNYYINSILETDKAYCIYLTDKYGNDIDELPICINKSTYTRCEDADAFDVEINGIECEIPEEYSSYRNKVKQILTEKYKEEQINVVVDSIFWEGYREYSLSELYYISNYLLELAEVYCSVEEKSNLLMLIENEAISSFFDLSDEEKLNCSKNHYYKTKSVEEFDVFGNEITPPDPVLVEICDLSDKFEAQFGYPLMIPEPGGVADVVLELAKISMKTNTDLLSAYLKQTNSHYSNTDDSFGFGYRPLENDKLLTPQFKPFGVDRPFSDAAKFGDKPFKPTQEASNKKGKGIKE